MDRSLRSALTSLREPRLVAAELAAQLEVSSAACIVFFCSHQHDGKAISAELRKRYPSTEVIGCTTAGEFTQSAHGVNGVSALALSHSKVRLCKGALAKFEGGVAKGMAKAAEDMSSGLGVDLRQADPKRYVGIILCEGLKMREEDANEALGNVAPLLSFVGGSAGDNLEFKQTRVFCNGEETNDGAALLLMDLQVPYVIAKTCSFQPSGKQFKVTKADVPERIIYELDGKPVLDVYARAVDCAPSKVDGSVFMRHPVGLMIDGQPWIRSPQRALSDGGLKFYCKVLEGMDIHIMNPTPLIEETRSAIAKARTTLGKPMTGGFAFNCILRRLELDAQSTHAPFLETFAGLQVAGFHTYGESYLGHINQTCTALLLG